MSQAMSESAQWHVAWETHAMKCIYCSTVNYSIIWLHCTVYCTYSRLQKTVQYTVHRLQNTVQCTEHRLQNTVQCTVRRLQNIVQCAVCRFQNTVRRLQNIVQCAVRRLQNTVRRLQNIVQCAEHRLQNTVHVLIAHYTHGRRQKNNPSLQPASNMQKMPLLSPGVKIVTMVIKYPTQQWCDAFLSNDTPGCSNQYQTPHGSSAVIDVCIIFCTVWTYVRMHNPPH